MRFADQRRASAWGTLVALWPQTQRNAFSIVDKAEQAYASAHAGGEIDLSGTARGMFEIDAEQSLRDDFLAAVESFEKGDLPNGTPAAAADADARLNAAYRKALARRRRTQDGPRSAFNLKESATQSARG